MEIKAFRGLRFDDSVVGDSGSCISPPYDVIDGRLQKELYDRNEHNVVRIIKGQTSSSDTETDNQYTRAGKYMSQWISEGALKKDEKEAIYGYIQDFNVTEGSFRRSGFIALGKLQPFGSGVQPHEKTLDGPKADRLKLMHAKQAQFGQIFMLYDDPEKTDDAVLSRAASKPALVDHTDDQGVRHRLYAIDDPDDIAKLTRMMSSRQAVIADGHHRYETALNYYNETQNPAAQYRMMTFVNMRNPGLVILPTHRLVSNLEGFSIDTLIEKIASDFEIVKFDYSDNSQKSASRKKMFGKLNEWFKAQRNAFGIYANSGAFFAIALKNSDIMKEQASNLSSASRGLDVNVLHKLILEGVLGIGDKQLASESNLEYIKDIGDAIDESVGRIDSGSAQVVFFMNSTRIEQVQAVAHSGEKMPQKSTFFYPKIYTGLVINKL